MPDVTTEFLGSPISFLHRIPTECYAEFIGLRTMNVQIHTYEETNMAQIVPTPRGERGALFNILGWQNDRSSTGLLTGEARFFFTGPLSGCTFAVDKNWYTPRVIHVNQHLAGGGMDVGGMMATVNAYMAGAVSKLKFWQAGPNITVVQSHNRAEDDTYNIFGYKTGGGWNFYQQVVETVSVGNKRVKALNELDTWF